MDNSSKCYVFFSSDILADHEVKSFFTEHSVEIYFVFYEEFTNLEQIIKPKGKLTFTLFLFLGFYMKVAEHIVGTVFSVSLLFREK